jgi:multidrug efflux pump subunit AcrA (membrane-fusion protein)
VGCKLTAEPDEAPAAEGAEAAGQEADQALYYVVDNADQKLQPAQRVFVELSLAGEAQRLVVPYAAVIYGLEGETWVYTNPEPLVYVRQPIVVFYIVGYMAVLAEGPSSGTPVVVVGVSELFGAETGVSK